MSPERGTPNGVVPGEDGPTEPPAASTIPGAGGVWRGTRWSPTERPGGQEPAGRLRRGDEPTATDSPGGGPIDEEDGRRAPGPLGAPVPPADRSAGGTGPAAEADRVGGDSTDVAEDGTGGDTPDGTPAGTDGSGDPGPGGHAGDDPAGRDDEGLGHRIRPYALTGGRTRSSDDLPLETLVIRTSAGSAALPANVRERHRILDLCGRPLSIAEISAYVGIHLGVARVLVGDMKGEGLLDVHRPRAAGDRPDIKLLERVLDGLQAL